MRPPPATVKRGCGAEVGVGVVEAAPAERRGLDPHRLAPARGDQALVQHEPGADRDVERPLGARHAGQAQVGVVAERDGQRPAAVGVERRSDLEPVGRQRGRDDEQVRVREHLEHRRVVVGVELGPHARRGLLGDRERQHARQHAVDRQAVARRGARARRPAAVARAGSPTGAAAGCRTSSRARGRPPGRRSGASSSTPSCSSEQPTIASSGTKAAAQPACLERAGGGAHPSGTWTSSTVAPSGSVM